MSRHGLHTKPDGKVGPYGQVLLVGVVVGVLFGVTTGLFMAPILEGGSIGWGKGWEAFTAPIAVVFLGMAAATLVTCFVWRWRAGRLGGCPACGADVY